MALTINVAAADIPPLTAALAAKHQALLVVVSVGLRPPLRLINSCSESYSKQEPSLEFTSIITTPF